MKNIDPRKQLIKAYLFLFILVCVIVNWDSIAWMFSYQEISGLTHDFFNPYPDSNLLVSASDIHLPPQQVVQNSTNTAPAKITYPNSNKPINVPASDKENSLEIPSIGIVTPLVIAENTDNTSLEKELDKGVVYYPGSVLPGESGQIIVLGHSAPPNWPHIKHDWVFSQINNLNAGDKIIMYFNSKQYTYVVKKKSIIQKGQEIAFDGGNKNVLTIVSCWPPGKDYQRIAVQAELSII